jgi:hypothetical protein
VGVKKISLEPVEFGAKFLDDDAKAATLPSLDSGTLD